jgi:shikimate dehydrogenase
VRRHAPVAAASGTDLQALPAEKLATAGGFDLVINASATSLAGVAPPAPAQVLGEGCCAVDLVYGPSARAFLDWSLQHGAGKAIDGLGMLVEQAALAFEGWRGVRPQTAPVLAALCARLADPGRH